MHKWIPFNLAALMMLAPVAAQVSVGADLAVPDVSVSVDPTINASLDAEASVEGIAAPENATKTSASGGLRLHAGEAEGRHLGMRIGPAGILDYRAGDATFFAAIDLGPLAAHASGDQMHGSFAEGRLQATDAASAGLRVDADGAMDATIRLAPEARADAESERLVWLHAEGRSGALAILGNGSISMKDGSIAIQLAPGSILRFDAHVGHQADWAAEQRSFADGRLGARLNLEADHADEYTVQVSQVRTGHGSVSFTVDSALEHARVVSVTMDAAWFSTDVEMRFDGQPAQRAASASEVHAASDSSVAVYSVTEVDGLLYASVHVPSFSAHDIEFVAAGDHAPSQDAPGFGLVALGCVVALVGVARRLRALR